MILNTVFIDALYPTVQEETVTPRMIFAVVPRWTLVVIVTPTAATTFRHYPPVEFSLLCMGR